MRGITQTARGTRPIIPLCGAPGIRARQRRQVRALRIAGAVLLGLLLLASAPDCRPRRPADAPAPVQPAPPCAGGPGTRGSGI